MPVFRQVVPALLFSLSFTGFTQAAEPPAFLGKADCRIAAVKPHPVGDAMSWSGACKDGYAEGKGVLEWRAEDGKRRLEATLVRGEVDGPGTLSDDGSTYTGSLQQGLPHGSGYAEYKNGLKYEGAFADGLPEGLGISLTLDGSTYEGEWKAGQAHGRGRAEFTLGGSYDGEWRDSKAHGMGTIVYIGSGQTYTGEFRDGRPANSRQAATKHEQFVLKGRHQGSFKSFDRSIGYTPPDAEWGQLTPDQQNLVRDIYPALADGDEPPYPLKGTRAFLTGVADLYQKFTNHEGTALVHVLVGADGVPKSASAYGAPHPELGRYLSMVAMMQRFKPAMCAGTPCEMIYPTTFSFTTK